MLKILIGDTSDVQIRGGTLLVSLKQPTRSPNLQSDFIHSDGNISGEHGEFLETKGEHLDVILPHAWPQQSR
jgi:hypothetical protein